MGKYNIISVCWCVIHYIIDHFIFAINGLMLNNIFSLICGLQFVSQFILQQFTRPSDFYKQRNNVRIFKIYDAYVDGSFQKFDKGSYILS